jgi:polar amino acid transport system substrate-binding protein
MSFATSLRQTAIGLCNEVSHPVPRVKRGMSRTTLLMLLIAGMFLPAPLLAKERIIACTNNYEPYYGENLSGYGPVIRITRLAFNEMGYDIEVRFSPWARVLKEAQAGRCDVVVGVWFDTGRTEWMALTDALLVNEIGFYKRKGDSLTFSGYSGLKSENVVIGTVRGYISPKGLLQAGIGSEEEAEDLLNMKKLLNNRIRLALVDRRVGTHLVKKSGQDERIQWLVTLQQLPLRNAVIKTARGDWKKRLADFNRGLALITRRGDVTRILREQRLSP